VAWSPALPGAREQESNELVLVVWVNSCEQSLSDILRGTTLPSARMAGGPGVPCSGESPRLCSLAQKTSFHHRATRPGDSPKRRLLPSSRATLASLISTHEARRRWSRRTNSNLLNGRDPSKSERSCLPVEARLRGAPRSGVTPPVHVRPFSAGAKSPGVPGIPFAESPYGSKNSSIRLNWPKSMFAPACTASPHD